MIRRLCILLSVPLLLVNAYAQPRSPARADRVIIVPKQIVIVRSGEFVRRVPGRKKATIRYPFVSGLRDQKVLSKVRALLNFEKIFDTSLKEYREFNWLDEFDYEVNYNADYLLDITFTQFGTSAYPDSQSRTIVINLRTGNVLKARDIFVEEKFTELARAVDEKLQTEVAELIQAAKTNEDGPSIVEALKDLKFEVKNLDDLSISKDGVTFLYDVGFPHVHQAYEPVGRYLFSYSTLKPFVKPGGPLAPFVKP